MAKHKYPSELNTKLIRVSLGHWAMLLEISRRAGVTIDEALSLALKAAKPEPKREPKPEPAQIPMMPVSFKPKFISGVVAFKPASISGNGVAHIKLKSIKEV